MRPLGDGVGKYTVQAEGRQQYSQECEAAKNLRLETAGGHIFLQVLRHDLHLSQGLLRIYILDGTPHRGHQGKHVALGADGEILRRRESAELGYLQEGNEVLRPGCNVQRNLVDIADDSDCANPRALRAGSETMVQTVIARPESPGHGLVDHSDGLGVRAMI